MKSEFAYYLTTFLSKHLPGELGLSSNSISSYRDTFILLLKYFQTECGITAEKILMQNFNKDIVSGYLTWLEKTRGCTAATRNVRLAAIRSFFQYLQYTAPEYLQLCGQILSIPLKKTHKTSLTYLSLDGIKLLLKMPNTTTKLGRRDLAMLSLMYDTAARVQELADLTPSCIRFENPATIQLHGKGNKTRIVPMLDVQLTILKHYMEENALLLPQNSLTTLFQNRQGNKLTRAGIDYILDKYINMARAERPDLIPEPFSCHCMRHSKAMHLLQAGVNLVYIRDILGHSSVQTTEIYAKADSCQKREAIERAYSDVVPQELPAWQTNTDLLEWLTSLGR